MTSVLITAFEPYEPWQANSSWLTLVELTKEPMEQLQITTRLYPVDYSATREKLAADLETDCDYALHLGQAPGAQRIRLEAMAINVGGSSRQPPEEFRPLVEDGPVAYRSELPLGDWVVKLRQAEIPAEVSYHAGTFLCNATLYMSHYLAEQRKLGTKAAFVHLPLDVTQAVGDHHDLDSLPCHTSAAAVRLILKELSGDHASGQHDRS